MPLELRTTNLDKHRGVGVGQGHSELLTLAPGQSNSPGSLMLVDPFADLPKAESIRFRTKPEEALDVRLGSRQGAGYNVTIHAKALGYAEIWVATDLVGVVTVGPHLSHLGPRAVDLLTRVSNGPDARKIVAIQQILQSRGRLSLDDDLVLPEAERAIVDQYTGAYGVKGQLLCGTVAQRSGTALFGRVEPASSSYHKPILARRPDPMKWDDIQYDPKVTDKAVERIKAHLDRGTAVRLGMVYAPDWKMLAPNGALQPERGGGHTILVVGYVGDQFLYLDPYPTGSRLTYLGGLPFNNRKTCDYLGLLGLVLERGKHLRAIVDKELKAKLGAMEVISGP